MYLGPKITQKITQIFSQFYSQNKIGIRGAIRAKYFWLLTFLSKDVMAFLLC